MYIRIHACLVLPVVKQYIVTEPCPNNYKPTQGTVCKHCLVQQTPWNKMGTVRHIK